MIVALVLVVFGATSALALGLLTSCPTITSNVVLPSPVISMFGPATFFQISG